MINGQSILAIIPARGGSKRLPGKNVKKLGGKPLIAWTIEAAKGSAYIDRIIVSTDSDEIARTALEYGAEVPFIRPEYLATDTASSEEVIEHALNWLEENEAKNCDYFILLQPTSPLRDKIHIDEAFELLIHKNADAIVSVCKNEHNPLLSNTLPEDGNMEHFIRDNMKNECSQKLPEFYRLNGAIYICKTDRLIKEKTFFINDNIFAYQMKREHSIDIDDEIDFELTKLISNKINK